MYTLRPDQSVRSGDYAFDAFKLCQSFDWENGTHPRAIHSEVPTRVRITYIHKRKDIASILISKILVSLTIFTYMMLGISRMSKRVPAAVDRKEQ